MTPRRETPEPRVCVVIPTIRGSAQLHQCLAHLAAQTYAAFEVVVVTDAPAELSADGLQLRCIGSGAISPNAKRLLAAETSQAELVALIDDDAYPAADWLERLVGHFDDLAVVAAGGPGVTPPEDDALARASGAVFASPLVCAGQRRRYVPGALADVAVLPACNLVVRRGAFLATAPATIAFWPGEDTLQCALLRRGGKRIVYDPRSVVYHHRRPLFAPHLRQVWRYAVARGRLAPRYPALAGGAYVVPLLFLAGHLAAAATLARVPAGRRPVAALAALYAGLVVGEARRAAARDDVDPSAVALGIYLTHLTYGAGLAAGLVRAAMRR